jgi:hypothetical protein
MSRDIENLKALTPPTEDGMMYFELVSWLYTFDEGIPMASAFPAPTASSGLEQTDD